MNYRDKIRKAIECPEFGNSSYGAWGSLRIDQRRNIKRLLDELDSTDDYIKKLYKEKQELIDYLIKQINNCDECIDVINSDLQEIKARGTGKTYLTTEIFKNKIAKKVYEEILSKIEMV